MKLHRSVLRLDPACIDDFDEIAAFAASELACDVSRAAVMRVALRGWLQANADLPLEQILETIRPGIVKRGRRPRGLPGEARIQLEPQNDAEEATKAKHELP